MECSIEQSKMNDNRQAPGPSFLSLFLILVVLYDLLLLVYPLVIEGLVIGDVLPNSAFDLWIFDNVLGGFTYDRYAWGLLGFFALGCLGGGFTAWLFVWPPVRRLIKTHEVLIPEKEMGLRVVADVLVFTVIFRFLFDRAVAFFVRYPDPFPSITFVSFVSGCLLAGFITGNGLAKFLFYVRIRLQCMRRNLKLVSVYRPANRNGPTKQKQLIRWALERKTIPKAA